MPSYSSIFISYRRSDTIAETGRIYDRLVAEFGSEHVFQDVDDIPLGVDFAEHLDAVVGQCQVMLVIMGKTWATVTEADGTRRLDNPDDFVRIEVESALKRGIPVIPLLLDGVAMPQRSQLPASLHPLLHRNGTQVGYNPRFHTDMDRLIRGLQSLMRAVEAIPEIVAEALAEDVREGALQEKLGSGVILDMVRVPGGDFLMGSPDNEGNDDEWPQHRVKIEPFLIGKYPVTQAQWRVVAALPKVERELEPEPSYFKGDNKPVEQVSWDDAVEFCQRLTRKTGKDYRLPSEAEWEYACRAGTTTAFNFGETITSDLANCNATGVDEFGPKGEYLTKTTDVGSYPANGFGLYDLHGNVWEWCQDDWYDSYEGAPTDGSVWEASDNSNKVVRGGSWDYVPRLCRSAIRYFIAREFRDSFIGFRVSCRSPMT